MNGIIVLKIYWILFIIYIVSLLVIEFFVFRREKLKRSKRKKGRINPFLAIFNNLFNRG